MTVSLRFATIVMLLFSPIILVGVTEADDAGSNVFDAGSTIDGGAPTELTATFLPTDEQRGVARLLVTFTNRTNDDVTLNLGEGTHGWVKQYGFFGDWGGQGSAVGNPHAAAPDAGLCPPAGWVIVVPSGSSVSRVQEIELLSPKRAIMSMILHVRMRAYASPTECGPTRLIEKTFTLPFPGKPVKP